MGDIPARLAVLNSVVTQTLPTLQTQYTQTVRASATLGDQNSGLQDQVRRLEAKHASLEKVADTYDREFLDRPRVASTFWTRRGFQTFQDWLLGAFFLVYAIVCLGLLGYTLLYSTKKLQGAALVVAVSVVLGVMMTGVISRFA